LTGEKTKKTTYIRNKNLHYNCIVVDLLGYNGERGEVEKISSCYANETVVPRVSVKQSSSSDTEILQIYFKACIEGFME